MTALTIANTSGMGMFFQADVLRVLDGIHAAITAPLDMIPQSAGVQAYRAGHDATMTAICKAFGLAYVRKGVTP